MLSSEVHHSPSAGMREHLYSVRALSVAIAAGQKKAERNLATNSIPTNAQQAIGFIRTLHKFRKRGRDTKSKVDGRESNFFNIKCNKPL